MFRQPPSLPPRALFKQSPTLHKALMGANSGTVCEHVPTRGCSALALFWQSPPLPTRALFWQPPTLPSRALFKQPPTLLSALMGADLVTVEEHVPVQCCMQPCSLVEDDVPTQGLSPPCSAVDDDVPTQGRLPPGSAVGDDVPTQGCSAFLIKEAAVGREGQHASTSKGRSCPVDRSRNAGCSHVFEL